MNKDAARSPDHAHQHHHHRQHRHQHDYRPSSPEGGKVVPRNVQPQPEVARDLSRAKKTKASQKALRRKLVSYIENIMHSDDDNENDDDDDDSDDDDDEDDDQDDDQASSDGPNAVGERTGRNSLQTGREVKSLEMMMISVFVFF